jgi:hypothetical protein
LLTLLLAAIIFSTKRGIDGVSSLTVCLLNYRRKENYERIIPALKSQTVKPKIFLWNNGEPFTGKESFLPLVDELAETGKNEKCWIRWKMAQQADTDFICSWDDDLLPKDDKLFADAMEVYDRASVSGVVGPYGLCFQKGLPYERGLSVKAEKMMAPVTRKMRSLLTGVPAKHHRSRLRKLRAEASRFMFDWVDLVKGRHILFPKQLLPPADQLYHPDSLLEDDIVLCARIANGEPRKHAVPAVYRGRITDLDTDVNGVGINRQSDHLLRRQKARELFFPGL